MPKEHLQKKLKNNNVSVLVREVILVAETTTTNSKKSHDII